MKKIFASLFALGLVVLFLYLVIEIALSSNGDITGWIILISLFCILVAFVISDSRNRIRPIAILLMAGLTILTTYIVNKYLFSDAITNNIETIIGLNGFWTFVTVIVSAPTLFVIWHFRDVNNAREIENQRKDINLKEFQKIVEWVGNIDSNTDTSSPLIVSSVYSLLPFYRGDYGRDFRLSAFYLLQSIWKRIHEENFHKLIDSQSHFIRDISSSEVLVNVTTEEDVKKIEHSIRKNSSSILANVIIQVLLSDNGGNLPDSTQLSWEIFLCGLNLSNIGVVSKKVFLKKEIVNMRLDVSILDNAIFDNCNLHHVSFSYSSLNNSFFKNSKLRDVDFFNTDLDKSNFYKTEIQNSCFKNAKLIKTNLEKTKIESSDFSFADLREAIFIGSVIEDSNFSYCNLLKAEGIIEMLEMSVTLTGSIIEYRDDLFTDNEVNKLRKKEVVFIKGSFTAKSRRDNRLIINPCKSNIYFSYDVSEFEIDMEETIKLNPLYNFNFPGEPFLRSETEIQNTIERLYRRQS